MNDRWDRVDQDELARLRAALAESNAALRELESPRPIQKVRRSQRDIDDSTMRAVFVEWVDEMLHAGWSKRRLADGLNDIDVHFFQDLLDGKRRIPSWMWPAMARISSAAFARAMARIQPAELSRSA